MTRAFSIFLLPLALTALAAADSRGGKSYEAIVVSDGSGTHTTVQAAKPHRIVVNPDNYREHLIIPANKPVTVKSPVTWISSTRVAPPFSTAARSTVGRMATSLPRTRQRPHPGDQGPYGNSG